MLRQILTAVVVLLSGTCLHAQSYSIDRNVADLGTIEVWNNDTARFIFFNTGNKTIYLLPTLPADDIQILITSKTIAPGEQVEIGLVYYTERKGHFSRDVSLYFSAFPKPVVLTVKGNIKQFDAHALVHCPSIEPTPQQVAQLVPVSIIVRDGETDRRLDSAEVNLKQKQQYYKCGHGYGNMTYVARIPNGKYLVSITHEGYEPYANNYVFDENNNSFIVYLNRKKTEPEPVTVTRETQQYHEKEVVFTKDTTVHYIPVAYQKDTVKPVIPPQPKPEFDITLYAPNNIVFLIDVSGSMQDSTKLEYLKLSMKQLIGILRRHDYVTIITYSSKVKTLVEKVSGDNKQILYACIDSLKAKGESRGAEGLKLAYESARANFISHGNNQVILSTDGLFNDPDFTEKHLYKLAKTNAEHDIKLSVVAFGKRQNALNFLQNLSEHGKGEYLRILTADEARHTLIEEIKKQSEIR